MAGQGNTIKSIADALCRNGWIVLYKCVPNRVHIGVVPIPSKDGGTRQHYPDVLSIKGNRVRLTEVEVTLSPDVVAKIAERFQSQRSALEDPRIWDCWRDRLSELAGINIPKHCIFEYELVLCKDSGSYAGPLVARLTEQRIDVYPASKYVP
jgi:hypothetical protein